MRPLGLRAKAALLFLCSTLLVDGIAGGVLYGTADDALRAAALAEIAAVANEKEAAVAGIFAQALLDVTRIAGSESISAAALAIRRTESRAQAVAGARADLARWVGPGALFTVAFLMDARTAEVVVATDPLEEGQFRESYVYFIEGLRAPFVQNPYYSVPLRGPAITAAAPVRAGGDTIAVVAGRVALERLNEVLARGVHPTSDAYLVDAAGLLVTQPRSGPEQATLRVSARTPEVDRCLAGEDALAFASDHRGARVLARFRHIADRQLCLVTSVDEAEALAGARSFAGRLAWLIGIAGVILGTVAVVAARSVTQPIVELGSAVARAVAGDRHASIPVRSDDEIGQLAGEFNRLTLAIDDKERELAVRADRLGEANAELEAFSYSVAHDLRAPLRAIDGFARALVEDHSAALDEEGKHFLERICAGTARMAALIDDLLRLSRVSRAEMRLRRVDVTRLARDVIDDLRRSHPERHVNVVIDDGITVLADPPLARVAIANLLENAWKFTRPTADARIEVTVDERDGVRWVMVRDNGVGFDPAHRDLLFGAFRRLHSSADFPGTGIGLATVRRIAVRHGGAVSADGAVGQGACFGIAFGPDDQPDDQKDATT